MAILLLRVGLALVFLYPAIAAFLEPQNWIGFLPVFIATNEALFAFGVFEIILALWLLSGFRVGIAALISGALVLGIVLTNFGALDIVFRDIPIIFASAALYVLSKKPSA